jgi:protocatechuate 3,4-dioxygenase beta subunit
MSSPLGSIAGRVVDAAGAPVAGAPVAVAAGPQPHSDIAALSGADGRFRLSSLVPGHYRIAAHSESHGSKETDVDVTAGQQALTEIRFDD